MKAEGKFEDKFEIQEFQFKLAMCLEHLYHASQEQEEDNMLKTTVDPR
jgi:hypothetical protein